MPHRQELKQVPAAVTIIDRRTIESSTAVDLVDLFRLVPASGLFFTHNNGCNLSCAWWCLTPFGRKIDGRSVYELLSSLNGIPGLSLMI